MIVSRWYPSGCAVAIVANHRGFGAGMVAGFSRSGNAVVAIYAGAGRHG